MENPAQDGWLWDIMVVLISAWGSLYKFIAKTEEILREWKKEVASDRCVNNSNLLRLFLLCFCMVCCVFNPKQLDTQLHTYKEDTVYQRDLYIIEEKPKEELPKCL
jgi:hypothetical protein